MIRVIIGGFRADIVSLIKLHMSVFLHGIRVKNSVKTLKEEVAKSRCDYHQEGSLMHYKIMGHLVPYQFATSYMALLFLKVRFTIFSTFLIYHCGIITEEIRSFSKSMI